MACGLLVYRRIFLYVRNQNQIDPYLPVFISQGSRGSVDFSPAASLIPRIPTAPSESSFVADYEARFGPAHPAMIAGSWDEVREKKEEIIHLSYTQNIHIP